MKTLIGEMNGVLVWAERQDLKEWKAKRKMSKGYKFRLDSYERAVASVRRIVFENETTIPGHRLKGVKI